MSDQSRPIKGTAFTLYFTLYKNDGTVIANPGTYTKKISKDGGAVADCTNSVTEVDTTYGECSLVLSATEMNADAVWVQIKDDTSGCVPFTVVLYPAAANLTGDPYAILNSGTYGNNALKTLLDTTGIKVATNGDKTGYGLAADQAVNVTKVNGTSQTARDLGASVLVSPGTGTGQLDVTSGVIKANLAQILGTALTETSGYLAAGFKKFFNVATPVHTMATVDQTGDSYARLGAPAGASLSADVAAVAAKTTNLPSDPADESLLEAAIAALNDLSGSDVRAAVGLDSANLDTQLTALPTNTELLMAIPAASSIASAVRTELSTELGRVDAAVSSRLAASGYIAPANGDVAAIKAKTDNLPADPADESLLEAAIAALHNLSAADVRTALGLASANLDTQLGDLPTNSELATALAGADDATLSAIAALNNLSSAQAQSAAAAALSSYDPPTKAELDAAVSPLATASALSTLAGYVDTEVAAILTIAQKLDTAFELDGAVYRFTANALEQAPTGSGSGTTAQQVWEYATRTLSGKTGFALTSDYDHAKDDVLTPLADLPTNAELATALGTADDAVLAAIAAVAAKTNTIGSLAVTWSSPVAASGTITIYAGDDYASADSRAITCTAAVADAPSLTGATVKLKTSQVTWTADSCTSDGTNWTVVFTPDAAETALLTVSRQSYELEATLANGHVITLARGSLVVVKDIPEVV